MKTPPFTKTYLPSRGINPVTLAIASLLSMPVAAWSSPTLLSDSYVATPFVAGERHGADPAPY